MGVELAEHGRWYNGTNEHKGKRFRRVSTLLNVINKPQLQAWREKQILDGIRAAIHETPPPIAQGLDSWTETVVTSGKAALERGMNESTSRGTEVHSIVQALAQGNDVYLPESLEGYVNAWQRWHDSTPITIENTEITTYSEKLMVAGTIDWLGISSKQVVIGDYKTGSVWPEAAYQLAAYTYLLEEHGVHVDQGIIVQLNDNGTFKLYEVDDLRGEPLEVFLATHQIITAGEPWK